MSNPWRETQGYSFHSICLRVKDIEESTMFYQNVFGMPRSLTQAWISCARRTLSRCSD